MCLFKLLASITYLVPVEFFKVAVCGLSLGSRISRQDGQAQEKGIGLKNVKFHYGMNIRGMCQNIYALR